MSLFTRVSLRLASTAMVFAAVQSASAQVVVHGTRHIFPGDEKEITVRVENVGNRSALVQAWTDLGDSRAMPEQSATPFVLHPAVFRLDGGNSRSFRVLLTQPDLPQDRESLYWLNVLDIPPAPAKDTAASNQHLQFTLRTRTKLIYRPAGLKTPGRAAADLQWSLQQAQGKWMLQARNSTPHYVNMGKVELRSNGRTHVADSDEPVAPFSTQTYLLPTLDGAAAGGNVQFQYLNDQGGVVAQSTPLSGH